MGMQHSSAFLDSTILNRITKEVSVHFGEGQVFQGIPLLKDVNPQQFGIALRTVDGQEFSAGCAKQPFSIQSISKLFTLMLALEIMGEDLWKRVGREPSGMQFNSLQVLEAEDSIPRNPFVNAGALIVTDSITMRSHPPAKRVQDYISSLSNNPSNLINHKIANAEKETGFLNAAIANLLKAKGILDSKVEDVLDCYFKHCAIEMSCLDLVRATQGLVKRSQKNTSDKREATRKHINALMLTCGLYNASGNFAYRVGLPAKSGIGGGIVAVLPGQYSVAVWGPELDQYGNSVLGQKALEKLIQYSGLSLF